MNLAIDSLPLTESIYDCADYSGLQVHSLTNQPLAPFVPAFSEKNLRIDLPDDLFWSDGSSITAQQYLQGIKISLSKNPFLRKYLLRNLKSIEVQSRSLIIECNSINFRIAEVFRLACFSPYSDQGLSSGKWKSEKTSAKEMIFSSTSAEKKIRVRRLTCPTENMNQFLNNELDVTADTAFPYNRYQEFDQSPFLQKRSVGLYCALAFSGKLADSESMMLRQTIASKVSEISFDGITFGACSRITPFGQLEFPSNKNSSSIILAYDDFYPNREICESISETLSAAGFEVTLVQDDYYKPFQHYDVKLSIMRGLGSTPYLLFSSLLFSPVLLKNRPLQLVYAGILNKIETQPSLNLVELQNFISQQVPLVPLFEIPSLSLSRVKFKNPLTESLECA